MKETVAELVLLSESDAIVHGLSRYASAALWLCERCTVDMMVQLSGRCAHAATRTATADTDSDGHAATAASSSPARGSCVGPGRRYWAEDLMAPGPALASTRDGTPSLTSANRSSRGPGARGSVTPRAFRYQFR